MDKPQTTPADGLESSASPRHPKGGVGIQMAGAGSIPDAGNPHTTPEELAQHKTILESRLRAIAMSNTFGKSLDDLTAMNLDKMQTERSLFAVNQQIKDYVEGKTP